MSQQKREFVRMWEQAVGFEHIMVLTGCSVYMGADDWKEKTVSRVSLEGVNPDSKIWSSIEINLGGFNENGEFVTVPFKSGAAFTEAVEEGLGRVGAYNMQIRNFSKGDRDTITQLVSFAIDRCCTPSEMNPNCTAKGNWRKRQEKTWMYVPAVPGRGMGPFRQKVRIVLKAVAAKVYDKAKACKVEKVGADGKPIVNVYMNPNTHSEWEGSLSKKEFVVGLTDVIKTEVRAPEPVAVQVSPQEAAIEELKVKIRQLDTLIKAEIFSEEDGKAAKEKLAKRLMDLIIG